MNLCFSLVPIHFGDLKTNLNFNIHSFPNRISNIVFLNEIIEMNALFSLDIYSQFYIIITKPLVVNQAYPKIKERKKE